MSGAVSAGLRVTKPCEWCGKRFEMTREDLANPNVLRKFCKPAHRYAALRARLAAGKSCTVCGDPAVRVKGPAAFCGPDWTLLWRTCTGKWQSLSEAEALDTHQDGGTFAAYECPICGLWHRTGDTGPDLPERRARQELMGERLRAVGFVAPTRMWIGVSER
jgi:hypothetical protein